MIPIQDLLHRIRWDAEFGRAEFRIGYYDRIERRIVQVPLAELAFPEDPPNAFEWIDHLGELRTIPLHRIKEVYRNGELIWQRTH
ncbi:DUF504 domain-containing protein [Methylococcus geothermalis]|uniref:DUF504 domain-containing protein n=1 Tax=Methylococcus geothermalis TaxID=2681310 RepID=A0A858Q7S1_9GAMM|nr:DUF504 domain-containing protein [Methylococcus geothermalis]QJD29756.1 DUF504 domain-containing protein [Methylococcus geothermalis]